MAWQRFPTGCNAVLAAMLMAGLLAPAAFAQNPPPFQPGDFVEDWRLAATTTQLRNSFALPTEAELRQVQIDSTLRLLVEQLEDASFESRERAMQQLIEAAPDRLQIYALLQLTPNLSAEQRYRLLTVLREHLVRTPRGAIGISMQQVFPNAGANGLAIAGVGPIEVKVTDLIPGLPAERVLKIGDRISHVDGLPLFRYDDLPNRVQCKKPGETVALILKRPRENAPDAEVDPNAELVFDVLHLDLELGSAEMLREFNAAQAAQLNLQQVQFSRPSAVEELRLDEARAAADRLAPRPRPLAVAGPPKALNPANRDGAMLDPDVEEHPAIRNLIWQREELADGGLTDAELKSINEAWQRNLLDLYHQARSRSLTEDQQQFLRAVIDRYIELMQP